MAWRRVVVAAALTAALATPTAPARADSNADEADARFRRGTDLYRQRRYDEALLEFFTSNRLAPNRNVVFNIARSLEALGRLDEAYRYYRDFLAQGPDAADRAAAEARLAELAPRVALLAVASTPPGATVYLDRKDLGGRGETPLIVAAPPGAHRVLLEKAGHHPVERAVTLSRGARVELAVELEVVAGSVRIVSRPPGEVRVDRPEDDAAAPDATTTPATLRLPPGRHAIEVRAPGHRPLRRLIEVAADREQVIDAPLEPLPPASGTLALGGETGARVSIDGTSYGVLPLVSTLPAGRHRVTVTADGFDPWTRDVDVVDGSHAFLEVELAEREAEILAATRAVQRVGEAPASVSVLSGEELRAFGYETLADAARGVRGLYESDDRNYRAVGVRGFSRPGDYTNRVLVLRDGHVWNDDLIGSGYVGRDFAPDLSDVARLEVVRGPGSAFYGQGAFFGVINAVSLGAGEGPALAATAMLLSDGGSRASARVALPTRDGGATLSVSAYTSDGQSHFFEELRGTPSGGFARDADGEDALRAALRLRRGPWHLDVSVNRRKKQIPTATFDTIFDPAHADAGDGTVEQTVDDRGYVEARYARGALLVRAYGDLAAYRGTYPYDDAERGRFVLEDHGRGLAVGGEARLALDLTSWNRLTVGVEGARHDLELDNTSTDGLATFDHDRAPVGGAVFAVDELRAGEWLRLTAGARLDRLATTDDTVLSPRVAAVVRPYPRGRTKLVLGQAYRAPSEYEQYYNDDGVTQRRAERLDPEIVDTAELEHTHDLGRQSHLLGSLFASRMRKLIGLVTEEQSGLLVYENSDDTVRAFGAELEGRLRVGDRSWIGAALSFSDLDGGDALTRANSLLYTGSLRALWSIARGTTVAFEGIVNGPRRDRTGGDSRAMLLVNVVASGSLVPRLRWQVGLFNALDWSYDIPVGDEFVQRAIRQDRRRLHAGVRYEF